MINVKTSKAFQHDAEIQEGESKTYLNSAYAGKHIIVDFWHVKHLQDVDIIEKALTDAALIAGATLLHIHLHQFTQGGGVTGVALLAESHISVHTWPERDYAAFDIFMCGDAQAEKALKLLEEVFQPRSKMVNEILRGSE
ncbi:MAG: adenosylmethionine decarboxylase [Gammaproteobacteria bacterium]|nr:adenosylmethionine decarboxylase [Gammaproteobacteria bacterium]